MDRAPGSDEVSVPLEATSAPLQAPFDAHTPLAVRMRPTTLDEVVGQEHLLAPGKLLRRAIEADRLGSLLFYGPPGTGKTTLAGVIARRTRSPFVALSGVENSVPELRKVLAAAAKSRRSGSPPTVLFLDEVHRFNKAQQDVLLPSVESGLIRFIGATTQNPFFSLTSALISRSQVFALEPLGPEHLFALLRRALALPERGLGHLPVDVEEAALRHLAEISDGDARRCLTALEIAVLTTPPDAAGIIRVSLAVAEDSIQKKAVVYDRDDDAHYDTISAFIKSLRGGDPDAALYWLAKMLHAGEDIRFIARRLVICASEDIGMADSRALLVAVAAQQAVEFIGLPEAQIPLAHAAVYLATAPKSNTAYAGIAAARKEVEEGRTLAVPLHLRDGSAAGSRKLGRGVGYEYPHDHEEGWLPQAYLPEGRRYYHPTQRGEEKRVAERLAYWRENFEKQLQERAGAPPNQI